MERKLWIDALRALAIFLVIFGHQVKGVPEYFIFTSPVKMPLFFAISGYLFKMRDGKDKEFFKNWFRKLIIPWFALSLISFLPQLIMGANLWIYLEKVISGKTLWFMPCFVIAEVIHFYIRKYSKKEIHIIILCTIFTVLGLYLHKISILDYSMFNRALSVQLFFLIGYLFKRYESRFVALSWKAISFWGIVYLLMTVASLFIFPQMVMDVHLCKYYNYPYCFALICIGCLVLFTMASKSNFSNRFISIIGQNTLVLYIWHYNAIAALKGIMNLGNIRIVNIFAEAFLKTIWAFAVCNTCAVFINRYIPEIVGKPRLTKIDEREIK